MTDAVRIIDQHYHRNGISGTPFLVSIVDWPMGAREAKAAGSPSRLFLAVSFFSSDGEEGMEVLKYQTAVLNIGQVAEGDIENAWRGADYVGPAIVARYLQDKEARHGGA